MYKILALGKDNVLHCCSVDNKSTTSCKSKISVNQVNPNLSKLQNAGISLIWCYECSYLLEKQEEDNE